MDIKSLRTSLIKTICKYKYVCLIIAVGILLMLIPTNKSATVEKEEIVPIKNSLASTEEKLEEILSAVSGAGEVRVLLAVQTGEETIFKTDDKGSHENKNTSTVIVTDGNRNQTGLVQQTISPVYRGAIIVCEGADKPEVRLAITHAITNATGLRSDQVSVLKMK